MKQQYSAVKPQIHTSFLDYSSGKKDQNLLLRQAFVCSAVSGWGGSGQIPLGEPPKMPSKPEIAVVVIVVTSWQ